MNVGTLPLAECQAKPPEILERRHIEARITGDSDTPGHPEV
jgi:hypothetical protein